MIGRLSLSPGFFYSLVCKSISAIVHLSYIFKIIEGKTFAIPFCEFGVELVKVGGLAFQIQDDILDISGDEKVIGKPVHSDEKNEKSTYPVLHGMEESRKKVAEYTDAGIAALDGITAADEEHKSFLRELLMSLVEREK